MTTPPALDWAAIRRRYEETDAAVADICTEAGIERSALTTAARKGLWRRQKPRPFPPLRIPTGSAVPSPAGPVLPRPAAPPRAGGSVSSAKSPKARAKPSSGSAKPKARTVKDTKTSPSRTAKTTTPRTKAPPRARPLATPSASGGRAQIAAPPRTAADRRHLLDRLVAAISRKLEQLEHRMALDLDDAATATDHDRESRAIGALIDNLGKITEMETGLARTASGKSDPTDIAGDADRWRRELAGRLAKIVGAAPSAA